MDFAPRDAGPPADDAVGDDAAAVLVRAVQRGDHATRGAVAPAAARRPARRDGRVPHVPAEHAVGADRGGRAVGPGGRDAPGAAPGRPGGARPRRAAPHAGRPHRGRRRRPAASSPDRSPLRSGSSTRRRRSSTRASWRTPASSASGSWAIRRAIPTSRTTSCTAALVAKCRHRPRSAASTCTSSPSSRSPPSRSSRGSAGSGPWASTCPCTSGCPASPRPPACCGSACAAAWAPSLKVLRQQAGGVFKLATSPVHHPDATLRRPRRRRRRRPRQPAARRALLPVRRARAHRRVGVRHPRRPVRGATTATACA